jgi:exodeoxyribonuclease-3
MSGEPAKRVGVGKRLKIASWNINSVRARMALVERLIVEQQPDILCLQETKVLDDIFPAETFQRNGYIHRQLNGQRMHHGVAILSRVPLKEP